MLERGRQFTSTSLFLLALMTLSGACSSGGNQSPDGAAGSGGATGAGGSGGGGSSGSGGGSGGSIGGTGGGQNVVQTCVPPAAIDQPAAKLSETGCMDPSDTKKLAASVIPYEVNSPLWSDGADKQRGMALPTGGKIHVKDCAANAGRMSQGAADDGKWVMPIGTVMVKSFLFDSKLVETRLFVHFDATTWVGYSYKWDEAQTDATIVADERVEDPFNTGKQTVMWHIPSRMDCMTCHRATGGSTLGPGDRADEPRRERDESDRSLRRRSVGSRRRPRRPTNGARDADATWRERWRTARARTSPPTAAFATVPTTRISRPSTFAVTSPSRT